MKIAVCFFGITRSLQWTVDSIVENIICEAKLIADVKIFGHFYNQTKIHNSRSSETGNLNIDEHKLIDFDNLELETPYPYMVKTYLNQIKLYGDLWGDNYQSLTNLIHQLHSIKKVTEQVFSSDETFDLVVFCRPDLLYLDSFRQYLISASKDKKQTIYIPSWQHHGGLNDRFAICVGIKAAQCYGERLLYANEYCQKSRLPLGGEHLLKYVTKTGQMKIKALKVRAKRVRFNGAIKKEVFLDYRLHEVLRILRNLMKFQ